MLQIGTTFANRYRIERRIAGGGMGSVYEVTDLNVDRRCALKVMLPELANAPRLRERFALEARIPGRAESDHIVQVLDAGLEASSNHLFLVMELLRGEDLGHKLEREKRLAPAEALTCLRQLASALVKTHALGIIHRDLKPQNLFVGRREDGTLHLKVLDFGISKVLQETSVGSQRTEVMGSPQYMAPEQFAGHVPTPATDIFALAMIAYTLLVGDSYWSPEADRFHSPIAFGIHVAKGVHESAVGRALQMGAHLPARFDEWFFKATHLQPEQRYASAAEAVQALAAVLNDESMAAVATLERVPSTMPLPPVVGTDTMRPMESSGPLVRTAPHLARSKVAAVGLGVLVVAAAVAVGLKLNSDSASDPSAALSMTTGSTTPGSTTPGSTALPATAAEPALQQNTEVTATSPLQPEGTDAVKPEPAKAEPLEPEPSAPAVTASTQHASSALPQPSATAAPLAQAAKPLAPPLTKPTTTAPAAVKPAATATPGAAKPAQPAATKTLCYYALSSGRVVKYVPGQSKGAQKTFPCRQNSAGQYTKVP